MMARPQPKFSDEQRKEIVLALKREKNKKIILKLTVLKRKAFDGMKSEEISEQTGFHRDYVNKIVSKYKNDGLAAIVKPAPITRNHAYMSLEDEEEFLKPFKLLLEQGEPVEVSTITLAFSEQAGIKVTQAMIYDLLKRHNWRKKSKKSKKPTGRQIKKLTKSTT